MARTDIKRIKSRVINVVFMAIWKRWYFVSVKGIKGRDPRGLKEEEPHVLSICFSEWNWDWKESSNFHVLSQFSLPIIDWLNGWMKTAALPVGMALSCALALGSSYNRLTDLHIWPWQKSWRGWGGRLKGGLHHPSRHIHQNHSFNFLSLSHTPTRLHTDVKAYKAKIVSFIILKNPSYEMKGTNWRVFDLLKIINASIYWHH